MINNFVPYFENLNLTQQIKDRISSIYQVLTKVVKDEIKEIFISDYLQSNSARLFQNLYFFTDTKIIVVQNFQTSNDFFITNIIRGIINVKIAHQDYDFESIQESCEFR